MKPRRVDSRSMPNGKGPKQSLSGFSLDAIADVVKEQDTYGPREVGLTHPDVDGFVRISDAGDIELIATPGVGIIIHPQNRSITIMADHIKFVTKEHDGMIWNSLSFNPRSFNYAEPTFLRFTAEDKHGLYDGSDYYLSAKPKAD
jgi:hypothetical protein